MIYFLGVPILRQREQAAEPVFSILFCPAVDSLPELLAEALISVHLCPEANLATRRNCRCVLLQVQQNLGCAMGCGGVII